MIVNTNLLSSATLLASSAAILSDTTIRTRFEELEHYHRHAGDSFLHRPIDALLTFRSQLTNDASLEEVFRSLDNAVEKLHEASLQRHPPLSMSDRVMLASALYLVSYINWTDADLTPSADLMLEASGHLAADRVGPNSTHLGNDLFHIDRDLAWTLIQFVQQTDMDHLDNKHLTANAEVLRRIAMARATTSTLWEPLEFAHLNDALGLHYPDIPTQTLRLAGLHTYSFDYLHVAHQLTNNVEIALEEIISIAAEASLDKARSRLSELMEQYPFEERLQSCAFIIFSPDRNKLTRKELVSELITASRTEAPVAVHGLSLIEFLGIARDGIHIT